MPKHKASAWFPQKVCYGWYAIADWPVKSFSLAHSAFIRKKAFSASRVEMDANRKGLYVTWRSHITLFIYCITPAGTGSAHCFPIEIRTIDFIYPGWKPWHKH